MSILITAYKGRSSNHLITVTDTNGDTADFQATDLMRLKIGGAPDVPLLEVTNVSPAVDDTFLTPRENPATLHLHQTDTAALTPGIYDLEVGIVDDSDSDKFKHASKGVFVLLDTQAGAVANI